jgi:hypothetical protein
LLIVTTETRRRGRQRRTRHILRRITLLKIVRLLTRTRLG